MKRKRYGITAQVIGIITAVIMPYVLRAQTVKPDSSSAPEPERTYTAPHSAFSKQAKPKKTEEPKKIEEPQQLEEPKSLAAAVSEELARRISEIEPRVEIIKMTSGNEDHIPAGFYASITPQTFDTVFIYEGATDEFKVIGVEPGKEVIQAPDSMAVASEVQFRMNHFNSEGIPVVQEKKTSTQAMIIRSGFIPAQGFGTMRYRFAVKPGRFLLTGSSMITASVHLLGKNNIGTILCTVTSIDQKKGIFYLETANEVPKGERINWIVVNTP